MSEHELPCVKGFQFSGVACGIKSSGAPDLGLIYADVPAVCAGVFTRNQVRAAPVIIAEERAQGGMASAVLVNSGNANACTGKAGHRVTLSTTAAVAGALGCSPSEVLPASTGVIGHLLPGEQVVGGIAGRVQGLSPDGAGAFARAILTTDRGPKAAWRKVAIGGGRRATVLAIAKGAGMIRTIRRLRRLGRGCSRSRSCRGTCTT